MVHALEEIRRVLIPNGVMIDLRPVADGWPVEVVSRRERRAAGRVMDLPAGLEDDASANQAIGESAQRGWFSREQEGSFAFHYYWDSPNQMEEYVNEEWADFIGISEEVWQTIRSQWATADADARLRVSVKMLITRWKKNWVSRHGRSRIGMQTREVQDLYEYNYWANRRLAEAAGRVNTERFLASAAFPFGSLRGTLVHILDAEHTWRVLLQEGIFAEETLETEFPDLATLRQRWADEESAMRVYLSSLKDEDLGVTFRYTTPQGNKRERLLWHCLVHVVNHGTQHRSEAAAILTGLQQSPGDIDFTIFLNERKAGTLKKE